MARRAGQEQEQEQGRAGAGGDTSESGPAQLGASLGAAQGTYLPLIRFDVTSGPRAQIAKEVVRPSKMQ